MEKDMEKAFRLALDWYFDLQGVHEDDAREIVSLLDAGLEANEPDARAALSAFVEEARRAGEEAGNETILELVSLGQQRATAADALAKTKTLIEIRGIMDLPPGNAIVNRIRAHKIKECARTLL